jgi:transposase
MLACGKAGKRKEAGGVRTGSYKPASVMCITLKTILREVHPIKGFVYQAVTWDPDRPKGLRVKVAERKGSRGICSGCEKKGPGYDRQPERVWDFVPLWGLVVCLAYASRRIDCGTCGPTIEKLPWATGKYQICDVFRLFLAQWARLLSWAEVARSFRVGWADVYGAVKWVVDYGIENRDLTGVQALGVDEIHVGKKDKFWTLVYQIDDHCKRLLWIGQDRTEATFNLFFEVFGTEFCSGIRFICSDMWKPYLKAAAAHLPQALQILDPFHIVKKLNAAVDEIRREETRARVEAGLEPLLKKMRWAFLKKRCNWTKAQRRRMRDIEGTALHTLRAFLLVETFRHFWTYCSPTWAGKFLDAWCSKVAHSRLDPLKKVARTLQSHRSLLLNYFKACKQYSSGVVEGLNAKVKLTLKRSYGFRTANAREVALYHALGKLPEPSFTHSFF